MSIARAAGASLWFHPIVAFPGPPVLAAQVSPPAGRVATPPWLPPAIATSLAFLAATMWAAPGGSPARDATALVHVGNAGVDIGIEGEVVHVAGRTFKPVPFALAAGCHELIMSRAGEVLYRESFTLQSGEERVLTAWWAPATATAGARLPVGRASDAEQPAGPSRRDPSP